MCLQEQGRRPGSWKLGEAELTQLNWQYLLKFRYVVRSRTEQYDIVAKSLFLWRPNINIVTCQLFVYL